MLVQGLDSSWLGETPRYSARGMVGSICFVVFMFLVLVTKVDHACGHGFCDIFLNE